MISLKSHYGVKAMVVLAANYGKKPVGAREIATQQDIPLQYLQVLLSELCRARIINSRRGKNGGYMLLKRPDKITVWDIVAVFEGKMLFTPMESATGTVKTSAVYATMWKEAEKKITNYLKSVKISTLLNRVKKSS